ncbi:hypothetical protein KQX54_008799 [Cotesia glomerata]|uniref:Uncharacterized protein n=1 Tax=Cotesia glomerata TaxID=32391 RepID=A0AAV7I200_COTGL|nr:hypothetical protein KQX54_008799 [Cotesia glomerata]
MVKLYSYEVVDHPLREGKTRVSGDRKRIKGRGTANPSERAAASCHQQTFDPAANFTPSYYTHSPLSCKRQLESLNRPRELFTHSQHR